MNISALKNRLKNASSSYLRSAAEQPVFWQEWSDDVFETAIKLDRPILLDIGAVWCHWCHVMDRESYENEDIAVFINENMVPVKLDRDERPDIDRRFQAFVQATGGGGGWPLTCILTPEGKFFFGGTYFPPEDKHGRPGLKRLLKQVVGSYINQKDDILKSADDMFERLNAFEDQKTNPGHLGEEILQKIINGIEKNFDPVYGGFGITPKFPSSSTYIFLLALYDISGDKKFLDIVETSIQKMINGGIRDHVGGGFHRYSVDQYWHVPHFEKMTSDNAELLKILSILYTISKNDIYKNTAFELIGWYRRDMTAGSGGFFASQDADITLEDDGDYFTWRKDELENILNPEEYELFSNLYGISEIPHDLHETVDRNVLYQTKKIGKISEELKISLENSGKLLKSSLSKLLVDRNKRQAPFIDKTLYADINALMLSSYSRAYKVFNDEYLKKFFLKTLNYFNRKIFDKQNGFAHSLPENGNPSVYGLFFDQIYFAHVLLDAFEMTVDPEYFNHTLTMAEYIEKKYYDESNGGFFDRINDNTNSNILKIKHKSIEDIPVYSANAAAVRFFDRLYYLTGEKKYENLAEKTLKAFAGNISDNGIHYSGYGHALLMHFNPPPLVVIIGKKDEDSFEKLSEAAFKTFRADKEIFLIDPAERKKEELPEILREKIDIFDPRGKAVAFVCTGKTCAPPTSDPLELENILSIFGKK